LCPLGGMAGIVEVPCRWNGIGVTGLETFEGGDEEIDVEDIMRRIRESIRKRSEAGVYPEAAEQNPGDVSCCAEDIRKDLDYINSNWNIANNS